MATPTPDHYERLGVRPSASTAEVREAYRALVQRLHPDRLGSATPPERALAERRMREINESWRVLRDPDLRRAHDGERLAARARGGTTAGPKASGTPPRAPAGVPAGGPAPGASGDADLVDVGPPPGPLGFVLRHLGSAVLLLLLLAIFVATAYAGRDGSGGDAPPAGVLSAGDCIVVAPGPVVTVVPCTDSPDLRVVARVEPGDRCPAGAEARRLTPDGQTDCVVPA